MSNGCKPKLKIPAKKPARRHDLCGTKGNDPTKAQNTMIEPGIDVAGDLSAINDGNFKKVGQDFVVNGRTYGFHPDSGTTFPKSGPGFRNVDRAQHKLIKKLNSAPKESAIREAKKAGLSQAKIDDVLKLWSKCKK